MIIKYSTGQYADVLPKVPSDSNSVTFTISNTEPPRSGLYYPQLPIGLVSRKRSPRSIDLVARRANLGQLVFTISKSNRSEDNDTKKQYEIGQILEFDTTNTAPVDPMLVSMTTEIRHDTNLIDYSAMGLSEAEISVINDATLLTQDGITKRLNEVKQLRLDAENNINRNQKTLNEINKAIGALTITVSVDASGTTADSAVIDEIISKLTLQKQQIETEIGRLITLANQYANEASDLVDQLRSVSILVR